MQFDLEKTETHYPYARYLKAVFGSRTYKIVVSSHLTCPTRDGTIAKAGCAFCDLRGSSSYFGKLGRGAGVREQLQKRLPAIQERFSARKFLAYFQSYTNTYGEVGYLRQIYGEALSDAAIQGLCIGTRPDCLTDPVLDLLEEFARKTYVSLELGIQSFEDPVLEWLDRGHDSRSCIDALERLRERAPSVHTCVHLIFGSPPESPAAPREAAKILSRFGVKGAKLHQLMVLEHTALAERFRKSPFPILGLEEYAGRVLEFLEHLDPGIYIERLCATASHQDECLAPDWSRDRWGPHNQIRQVLTERGCIQGKKARHS